MSCEQKLRRMVEQGTITAAEALAFEESLAKLPSASVTCNKNKLPLAGLVFVVAAILLAVIIFMLVSSSGPSPAAGPQSVADVMNTAGATGDIGSAATSSMALFLLLGIPAAAILLFMALKYNAVIALDEEVKKTANFIENTVRRRHDLVPKLHSVVKEAMAFEEGTQFAVTEQRRQEAIKDEIAESATSELDPGIKVVEELRVATENMGENLRIAPALSAVVEAYPQLRSHTNIQGLQDELSRIETDLLIARNIHAKAIADANAQVRSIFGGLAASLAGVRERYQINHT